MENTLKKILDDQKVSIEESKFDENDVVVIPNIRLTDDDIQIIKDLRSGENKTVYIHDKEKVTYQDFRGGEYILAFYVIHSVLVPIFVGVMSSWIFKKISEWRAKKEIAKSSVKEPEFKVEFYVKDKERKVTLQGKANDVIEGLKKLKDDKND